MNRLILTTLVATTLFAAAANAGPAYGDAQRAASEAGQITPHGIWDSR